MRNEQVIWGALVYRNGLIALPSEVLLVCNISGVNRNSDKENWRPIQSNYHIYNHFLCHWKRPSSHYYEMMFKTTYY